MNFIDNAENTYQITASELIEICEAIQNGYTLESMQGDDTILSCELKKHNERMTYNFLR